MELAKSLVKKLCLKAGYTVLQGDIRKAIRDQADSALLPERLIEHAKVLSTRSAALKTLGRGGTVVEVGVAFGDFIEELLTALQPDTFIAIDTFGIGADDEAFGGHRLRAAGRSHHDYYANRFRAQISSGKLQVKKGLS